MKSGRKTGAGQFAAIWQGNFLLFAIGAEAMLCRPHEALPMQMAGVGEFFKTNIFALTILFIFLVALIGTFLARRSKDKCLKDFRGYRVTIETADGVTAWGKLRVYSNAVELEYADPRLGSDHRMETSRILYDKQYNDLRRICRFSDELTDQNRARREKDVNSTSHPSVSRRIGRWLRNVANTFRDALVESMGAAMAQAKKAHPSSAVMATQDARLSKIGQTIIGYAARAYEPVLKRHIFDSVLVEELCADRLLRHQGVLKEYSGTFLEILDVELEENFRFALNDRELMALNRDLTLSVEGKVLTVSNRKKDSLVLKEVVGKDFKEEINRAVDGGETVRFDLGGEPPDDAVAVVEAKRKADILFPRSRAWVRHGSV